MKERILMAEMKVDIEMIRSIKVMEINLRLSYPPEARRNQPALPASFRPGYQASEGRIMKDSNTGKSNSNLQNSPSVRVNSISVNVTTRV